MKNKIIAVSGGFDPVHIGHIRLFKESKTRFGGLLLVILNNDYWLMQKKGYVFMSQEDRTEILKSIIYVDQVILTTHSESRPGMDVCEELKFISPDVFANGGDRFSDNIPEYQLCKDMNIEMVFNLGDGGKIRSSSELVKRQKNGN